jgi:hypothetical protein
MQTVQIERAPRGRKPAPPAAPPRLVSVPAFSAAIGVSTRSGYRLLRDGDIPVVRLVGRTLISVDEIEKLIARRSGPFLRQGA